MNSIHTFHKKHLVAVTLMAFLLGACGGGEQQAEAPEPAPEPVAETTPPPPPPEPTPPPPPAPAPEPKQPTAEANYWADTHWAKGSEGSLLMGLNGGEYPPYKPAVIEELQRFLFDQGLYEGPVTGVLDLETMKATGRFQEAHNIVQSGVPSPETREAMNRVSSTT